MKQRNQKKPKGFHAAKTALAKANGTYKRKSQEKPKGHYKGFHAAKTALAKANGTYKSQKGHFKGAGAKLSKRVAEELSTEPKGFHAAKTALAKANGTYKSQKGHFKGAGAKLSKRVAEELSTEKPIKDQFDVGDLYHATVHGAAILSSGKMTGEFSQHGVQSCVWASDSIEEAIRHLLSAPRHKDEIIAANYDVHMFQIQDGTAQRALFHKMSRGGYSTSLGYKGAGGLVVPLEMDNNHTVAYEVMNIERFFKLK